MEDSTHEQRAPPPRTVLPRDVARIAADISHWITDRIRQGNGFGFRLGHLADSCYEEAVYQGYDPLLCDAYTRLALGRGLMPDPVKALGWHLQAFERALMPDPEKLTELQARIRARADFESGVNYLFGIGTPRNLHAACALLRAAATRHIQAATYFAEVASMLISFGEVEAAPRDISVSHLADISFITNLQSADVHFPSGAFDTFVQASHGSFGRVLIGTHVRSGFKIAVKFSYSVEADEATTAKMFARESAINMKIRKCIEDAARSDEFLHDHVALCVGVGWVDDLRHFDRRLPPCAAFMLAMEPLNDTLSARCDSAYHLSTEDAIRAVLGCANALAFLSHHGIVVSCSEHCGPVSILIQLTKCACSTEMSNLTMSCSGQTTLQCYAISAWDASSKQRPATLIRWEEH